MKQIHIHLKKCTQIFYVLLEISVIVGIATFLSCRLWRPDSGIDIVERVGLFYGFYQILTYIILSTLNDIKADEYLALRSACDIAIKACEYEDDIEKNILKNNIKNQLKDDMSNDLEIRRQYEILDKLIDNNSIAQIEYLMAHAEHCYSSSTLQWKFSFLLRRVK